MGTNIKVTEIDPGATQTEFSEVRWNSKERSDQFYNDFSPLLANDIADAIAYAVTRPAHVQIAEMLIYSTDQASPSLIHKKGDKPKSLFD